MRNEGFTWRTAAHTPEEKRKKVLQFLRLSAEGWPVAVVEKRSGTSLRRAREMAEKLGLKFKP